MNTLTGNKTLLVVERQAFISEMLSELSTEHTIVTRSTAESALDAYQQLCEDTQKKVNLIVFLDTAVHDLSWQELVEAMFSISVSPNIVLIDQTEDIRVAVAAYTRNVKKYCSKAALNPHKLDTIINEIHKKPFTQKQIDRACYEDDAWARHVKDDQCLLTGVKLKNTFEEYVKKVATQANEKPEADRSLFERAAIAHTENKLDVSTAHAIIESFFEMPILDLKKPHLLIIEDEHHVSQTLVDYLEDQYETFPALNGESAKTILDKESDISLALLDIFLPDIKGTDLYPMLRKKDDTIIYVALTAYKDTELAESLILEGVYDYTNKPIKPKAIWKKLARAWQCKVWPYFEDKMELNELNLIQKMYFLDYQYKDRMAHKAAVASGKFDPKAYTKYQLNSVLSDMYAVDIFCLFPEFYDLM